MPGVIFVLIDKAPEFQNRSESQLPAPVHKPKYLYSVSEGIAGLLRGYLLRFRCQNAQLLPAPAARNFEQAPRVSG